MSLKEGHSNKICYVASNLFLTEDKMNKQCCGLTFFLLKKNTTRKNDWSVSTMNIKGAEMVK